MNTQPVFLIADTHICPNNAIAATCQPPRLRALSTFSRPVDETALKLISLPPPLTHTLTIVTFSGKANWGNISAPRLGQNIPVLNAIPMKYHPRSPRATRHAHANRHASWGPNSDILPRVFRVAPPRFIRSPVIDARSKHAYVGKGIRYQNPTALFRGKFYPHFGY